MPINKFIQGHLKFKQELFPMYEKEFVSFIKHGQKPSALFIGCCDSRVDPNLITQSKPGEIFYLRNLGNMVPPYESGQEKTEVAAAIEFALHILKVEDIIICGHSDCGACEYLHGNLDAKKFPHLHCWLTLDEKLQKLTELNNQTTFPNAPQAEAIEKLSLLRQIENLIKYPNIEDLVQTNKIHIHGWYFNIKQGELEYYDSEKVEFRSIEELAV